MSRSHVALALIFAAAMILPAQAETVSNLGVSAGYTDNLFADSTLIDDSYTRAEGSLEIYPTAITAIDLAGGYTAFGRTSDLNYFDLSGSGSYLLGDPSGRVTTYFSAGSSLRRYGEYYREYNRYTAEAGGSLRAAFSPTVQGRFGGGFAMAAYPDAESGDFRRLSAAIGLNASLPGNNSVDLETSIAQTWLADLPDELATSIDAPAWSERLAADIMSLNYRVRWSRPVGQSVGLSLNITGRTYLGENQPVVPGYSLDNLSPWSDFWQGYSLGLDMKTFFVPHCIIGLGAAYRSAEFIDALESDASTDEPIYYVSERDDERSSAYIDFRRPIKLSGGGLITPVLEVGYTDNSSSLSRYEYSSVSASFRVTVTP